MGMAIMDNSSQIHNQTHKGGCHCGAVTFEFNASASQPVTLCNCSICNAVGYQHIFIAQSDVEITGFENLTLYTFGSGAAKHYFCKICGVKPLYIPKSHPEDYSVNLRCIKGGTLSASETIHFDGQNWEANIKALKNKT